MSAVPMVTKTGPRTFIPVEAILGGQLVEARAAGRIGVAAAGSLKVLGVAVTDATSPELTVTTPTTVNGRQVLNTALLPTNVGVAYGGIEVPVTYAAAAAFGDRLIAAAGGQVTPMPVASAAPTTADVNNGRALVGVCTAPAGVAAAAVGLMRTA